MKNLYPVYPDGLSRGFSKHYPAALLEPGNTALAKAGKCHGATGGRDDGETGNGQKHQFF
jgi:hypothetical protein